MLAVDHTSEYGNIYRYCYLFAFSYTLVIKDGRLFILESVNELNQTLFKGRIFHDNDVVIELGVSLKNEVVYRA